MFDLATSHDFYAMLVEDFDAFTQHRGQWPRHGNCREHLSLVGLGPPLAALPSAHSHSVVPLLST
jgi:hypothetical protein